MRLLPRAAFLIVLVTPAFSSAYGQVESGTCQRGFAMATLDANNVSATLYNTGQFFYPSNPGYEVPKGSGKRSIFAAGLWIGGLVDQQLRIAAGTYSTQGYDFYPGPLNADGSLPDPQNCTPYDRIYSVSRSDLEAYEATGAVTADLFQWPQHLGAPVVDGDGDLNNYNLAGGDRPEILGDQTLWWVMNDVGGPHFATGSDPIGLEVQVTAFAAAADDAVNNATVYKLKLIYRGSATLQNAHFGLWVDPDLGYAGDDFVGVDTLRSLGYAYNGDDFDDTASGYGVHPPAVGVDFLQGLQDGEDLPLTRFVYYNNDQTAMGNPDTKDEYFNYLTGRWKDGSPITFGGNGFGGSTPTSFMFSGEPPAYWSEENTDGSGQRNFPGDRRFIMSSGPFSMQPGDTRELAFAVVWALGSDRLGSIVSLQRAANRVQEWAGFGQDAPVATPDAPTEAVTLLAPADGALGQPLNSRLYWNDVADAVLYQLQLTDTLPFEENDRRSPQVEQMAEISLEAEKTYFWRVRGINDGGPGPWSETRSFATTNVQLDQTFSRGFGNAGQSVVEVSHPDAPEGSPCATTRPGCEQYGGKSVFQTLNSTGEYFVSSRTGAYADLLLYIDYATPRDFEIRFTEEGGYGTYALADNKIATVPFELWDIGVATPDDPSDDVRLIPVLYEMDGTTKASWGWAVGEDPKYGLPVSDAIYMFDGGSESAYDEFAASAAHVGAGNAVSPGVLDGPGSFAVGRITIGDYVGADSPPPPGTTIRFITNKPPLPLQPIASAPGDGERVEGTVLLWWQQGAADLVDLQVATDPAFSSIHEEASGLTQPPYEVTNVSAGQTLHWRIRSRNQMGQSDWSPAWSFSVGSGVAAADETQLPTKLELMQNYPNPFRSMTQVRYGLATAGDVRLEVFDLLGRQVALIESRDRAAGWHEVTLDARGWGSGMYFVRLRAAGSTRVVPVTVMK